MAPKRSSKKVVGTVVKTTRKVVKETVVSVVSADRKKAVEQAKKVQEEESAKEVRDIPVVSNDEDEEMQEDLPVVPADHSKEERKEVETNKEEQASKITKKGKAETKNEDEKKNKKQNRKKRGGKRMKAGSEGYARYVFRVLKQVHPKMGISSKAMTIVNSLMNDMFERLADESAMLIKHSNRATLSSREVQAAVRLVLPGELGKHAISEGVKAVTNYMSYGEGGS